MLKISKRVEYALMTLKLMHERQTKNSPTTAREVCQLFDIPFDTLSKVMQVMNNAKILSSIKGVKGGYILQGDLNQLNYADLYQLIEGPSFGEHCNGPVAHCNLYSKCNIADPLKRLNNKLVNFFHQVTILELIRNDL